MINESITVDTQLGTLLSEHGASQIRSKGNLWSGFVFVLLGVIALGAGLIAAVTNTGGTVVSFCGGVGLLSILGGGWAIRTHNQEKGMSVQIYADGIVSTKNGRSTAMRWDEVIDLGVIVVYNRQIHSSFYTYTLKDVSGQTLRLNLTPGHFENAEQLSQTIQQEVTRRQLGRAMTTLNAGEPVQFGPLTITQEGIQNGRKTLPWSEFKEIALTQKGNFVVRAHDKATSWARIDMVKMSNVFTFVALADQITGRQ